jgi:aminopeptidase N
MADANGEDLSGIGRWYSQAGTPTLTVTTAYDAAKKSFTISTHQVTPPTNGQPNKVPVLIPLKVRGAGAEHKKVHSFCCADDFTEARGPLASAYMGMFV